MLRVMIFTIPILVLVIVAMLMAKGLSHDPRSLPLVIQGQLFPAFRLPDLLSDDMIDEASIEGPALVNIWATWCPTCVLEHEALMVLTSRGVPIYGINYKNEPLEARSFLQAKGNPYRRVIEDYAGQLGIELGMFGAPETYFVDSNNRIYYRHVGEVTLELWESELLPIWKKGAESKLQQPNSRSLGDVTP